MDTERQRWEERYRAAAAAAPPGPRPDRPRGPDEPPSRLVAAAADQIRGRVLDVAAGAGRNALFLARRGCQVEALDFAHAGLRLALATARREGLRLGVVQADLTSYPLPVGRYDAVINTRYLLRSLFPALRRALKPGGLVVFETFLVQQLTIGHARNPDFLLQPGELRAAFADLDIVSYEEGLFVDGSRDAYLARLLARRQRD